MLAMTGCKIPQEISSARMNGKCGDIVSRGCRAEACAASTDDGLVRPFGNIEVATAEVLLNLLERVDLRTVHMNKIIGDKYGSRTNRLHQCSFITPCMTTNRLSTMAWMESPTQAPAIVDADSTVNAEADSEIHDAQ
jgi:hypothetical protein